MAINWHRKLSNFDNKVCMPLFSKLLCVGLTFNSLPAMADNVCWNALEGDWTTDINWHSLIVPASDDNVFISNDGVVQVSSNNSFANDIFLGKVANGSLAIGHNGVLSIKNSYVGRFANSNGDVSIYGGGKWLHDGILVAGYLGSGRIDISSGGEVSNTIGYIGRTNSGSGNVSVDGKGSIWINSSHLYIGHSGDTLSSLDISNGGEVQNYDGNIGRNLDSIGSASVSGDDSRWINSRNLIVGHQGNGNLVINNGGYVSNFSGYCNGLMK
jgi:T5SS/PEP-CTERM-associated repeat protein